MSVKDCKILFCDNKCDPTHVMSRAFWGYAPAWSIDKFEEFTIEEGWNFKTRRYINEIPENIKSEMISQGVPESEFNPRDYIYIVFLDESHYGYILLDGKEDIEYDINEYYLADAIVKNIKIDFETSNKN